MANRLDFPLVHAVHGPFNADASSPPARRCSCFPHGAAPMTIEHRANGFLVEDEREMAAFAGESRGIDPERCRRAAGERFSPARVAEAYEAVYREVRRSRGKTRRHLRQVDTRAA